MGASESKSSTPMLSQTATLPSSPSSSSSSSSSPPSSPIKEATSASTRAREGLENAREQVVESSQPESKPKPCCVCKPEKQSRDECMLFASSTDPASECVGKVEEYRRCMRGFGFDVA